MKKLTIFVVLMMVFSLSAHAVVRDGRRSPASLVLQGGYERIGEGFKQVSTGGTSVQLTTTYTEVAFVDICASQDNTGVITVGSSTTTAYGSRRGITLNANDCYTCNVDNLDDIYIDASVSGDAVVYTYLEYIK